MLNTIAEGFKAFFWILLMFVGLGLGIGVLFGSVLLILKLVDKIV